MYITKQDSCGGPSCNYFDAKLGCWIPGSGSLNPFLKLWLFSKQDIIMHGNLLRLTPATYIGPIYHAKQVVGGLWGPPLDFSASSRNGFSGFCSSNQWVPGNQVGLPYFLPQIWSQPYLQISHGKWAQKIHPNMIWYIYILFWLVVLTILKNISQWEGLSLILWKIKNDWNHQPVLYLMDHFDTQG